MAEAPLAKRLAFARKLVKEQQINNIGVLQGAVKAEFGRGIPPDRLSDIFGTSGTKRRRKRKRGARKAGAAAAVRRGRPRKKVTRVRRPPTRRRASDYPVVVGQNMDLQRWMDLVDFLNTNVGGRTTFSLKLTGREAALSVD